MNHDSERKFEGQFDALGISALDRIGEGFSKTRCHGGKHLLANLLHDFRGVDVEPGGQITLGVLLLAHFGTEFEEREDKGLQDRSDSVGFFELRRFGSAEILESPSVEEFRSAAKRFPEKILLAPEVIVGGGNAGPRHLGNRPHGGRMEAALGEEQNEGFQQAGLGIALKRVSLCGGGTRGGGEGGHENS